MKATSVAQTLIYFLLAPFVAALGGEKAFYETAQMTRGVSHRQDVCDRYDLFRNGTVELRYALKGLKLTVAMANYPEAYFNYDSQTGIDSEYPGLTAIILDELALRAGFTWRESFGLTDDPSVSNATWKELLLWSIDTYDVAADWWAQSLERMNMGVAFLEPWYDSSVILVSKETPVEISDEIRWWNWTRPYENSVWILTVFTIIVSGVVYQVLEWFADDRQERSMWEWWQENLYLSAINFTQAYEYQPKTLASRVFGISMAIWALVMTATYTANLASLLVDRKQPPVVAQSLDEVAVYGNRLCTWEGTFNDDYVRLNHPKAKRVPKTTIPEVYQGLHTGECDFVLDAVASWNKIRSLKAYNPYCDMYMVGGDQRGLENFAGFVSKVDSGRLCTGFIRDVINLHMEAMINDGFLALAWEKEYLRTQDINCDIYDPQKAALLAEQANTTTTSGRGGSRRSLRSKGSQVPHQRHLKGGGRAGQSGAAASAALGLPASSTQLTLEQMIGTFAFHWALMGIALVLATVNALYNRHGKQRAQIVTARVRNSFGGRKGIGHSATTRRCSDFSLRASDDSEVDNVAESTSCECPLQPEKQLKDMQSELIQVRKSQNHIEQAVSEIRKEQVEMKAQRQQTPAEQEMRHVLGRLLEEQAEMKAQLQALLGGGS